MRLLLDTNILLWALVEPARLTAGTRSLLEDPANEVAFSAASIWEIAIKASLGRIDFAVRPKRIAQAARETGFVQLAIAAAAARVVDLPPHPRPVRPAAIAQAMADPMWLCTADPLLPRYSDLVRLVT